MTDPIRSIRDIRAFGLDNSVEEWLARLAGPTWFTLPGRDQSRTRVVATLLHGSEPSGVIAVREWLLAQVTPAVNMAFYIGSVGAALHPPRFSHRMLPGARDANRCFVPPPDGEDGRLAEALLAKIRGLAPEALVDLHDNTGHSPAYGVGTRADAASLRLTDLFGNKYMLSDLSLGTLVEATSALCPSVVIECGTAGGAMARAVALSGLSRLASAPDLGLGVDVRRVVDVLHAPVRVAVLPHVELAIAEAPVAGAALTLRAGIDRDNFSSFAPGTPIGWVPEDASWPLDARGGDGREISRELFIRRDGVIETRREMVPIMMTGRPEIAKQDCLFYAMQRLVR